MGPRPCGRGSVKHFRLSRWTCISRLVGAGGDEAGCEASCGQAAEEAEQAEQGADGRSGQGLPVGRSPASMCAVTLRSIAGQRIRGHLLERGADAAGVSRLWMRFLRFGCRFVRLAVFQIPAA